MVTNNSRTDDRQYDRCHTHSSMQKVNYQTYIKHIQTQQNPIQLYNIDLNFWKRVCLVTISAKLFVFDPHITISNKEIFLKKILIILNRLLQVYQNCFYGTIRMMMFSESSNFQPHSSVSLIGKGLRHKQHIYFEYTPSKSGSNRFIYLTRGQYTKSFKIEFCLTYSIL